MANTQPDTSVVERLREIADQFENDRREPDKVLCAVQNLRRLATDIELETEQPHLGVNGGTSDQTRRRDAMTDSTNSHNATRICDRCGNAVVLGARGYTHRDGPDKHEPIPVKRRHGGMPVFEHVSRGLKRPSGDAAVFTQGDGRGRKR